MPLVMILQDGEEVCINYGEKRSNDTLLQFYGFVERRCRDVRNVTAQFGRAYVIFLDSIGKLLLLCWRDNANDTYTVDLLQHLDEEAAANGQKLEALALFLSTLKNAVAT